MPAKLRLKLANECNNLTTKCKLVPENKSYRYYLLHSKQIDEKCLARLFELFELLMKDSYEQSSWGWNVEEKLSEWRHSRTRILIVTKSATTTSDLPDTKICTTHVPDDSEVIIGFMCFRYEIGADKSECALYVYELHVDPNYQRQGLGLDLMRMANILAASFKMDKIMLTVFRSNTVGLSFYNKLNFHSDKSCPAKNESDYMILSSKVRA